jgi:hypothetical protein
LLQFLPLFISHIFPDRSGKPVVIVSLTTEVYPFYNWMIVNQPAFTLLSDGFVPTDTTQTEH